MSLREPKKSGMFAALGIKRNTASASTSAVKVEKKNKTDNVVKGGSGQVLPQEEGDSDMEFVVVPEER